MNLRKIALGVILLPAFCLSANASKQIMEEMSDHRKTPSTYSFSSQITAYEDLSLEEKYKENLRNFNRDSESFLQRMTNLAQQDNYEEAQLYMGAYYRLYSYNPEKAIQWYNLAAEKHDSRVAYQNLGIIYHSTGDYDEAKKNYQLAIEKGNPSAIVNLQQLESDYKLF